MARPLGEIHPFDPAMLADPIEFDRRLRAEAPVHRDPHTGVFLVSTYALVRDAADADAAFSSRGASEALGAAGGAQQAELHKHSHPLVDTLLTADPPEHTRFRRRVEPAFAPDRVNELYGEIEEHCHDLLDRVAANDRFEVRSQYAAPLSLAVIADQLGVPRTDLPHLERWTSGFTAPLAGEAGGDGGAAVRRMLEFQHYFAVRIDELRRAPRNDLLSELCRARPGGGSALDVGEILSLVQQLLVTGVETVAGAIAEGVWRLCQSPGQLALLHSDPSAVPGFVDEVLRLASPVQNAWRWAVHDAELGGVPIPAGALLLLRYGSANRDAGVFAEPDRLDAYRANAAAHLAFGHGIHRCVGAPLARAQIAAAFRALLERCDDLRVARGAEPPRYRPGVVLRGLAALDVAFSAR